MSDNIKAIGRVAATEKFPITVECFYFLTKKDIVVEPFDIVKVENFDQSITYGVVEEISHVTDSASFLSSFISNDFGNNMSYDDVSCRVEMNYIKARVIGNSKNINFPVINNSRVFKMYYDDFDDGAKKVLGFASDDKNAITCGYIEMYENEKSEEKTKIPVRLDSDFLIGPKGAHLNISGISGLAAKTSYAMFLLKAIQEKFATDANKGNVKKRNKKMAMPMPMITVYLLLYLM